MDIAKKCFLIGVLFSQCTLFGMEPAVIDAFVKEEVRQRLRNPIKTMLKQGGVASTLAFVGGAAFRAIGNSVSSGKVSRLLAYYSGSLFEGDYEKLEQKSLADQTNQPSVSAWKTGQNCGLMVGAFFLARIIELYVNRCFDYDAIEENERETVVRELLEIGFAQSGDVLAWAQTLSEKQARSIKSVVEQYERALKAPRRSKSVLYRAPGPLIGSISKENLFGI